MIELTNTSVLLGLAINGVFVGLGTAVGSYFAQAHLIKNVEKFIEKIKEKPHG